MSAGVVAIPSSILALLGAVPSDAWDALESAISYIVHGGDPNDARVRAEALAAHALLRVPFPTLVKSAPAPASPTVPLPVAVATPQTWQ